MQKRKKEILIGLMIALLIVVLLAPFASSSPDGLERVAEDLAFLEKAEDKELISSPIPDYVIPGLENEALAGILAGVTGTLVTFGVMMIFAKMLAASKKKKEVS